MPFDLSQAGVTICKYIFLRDVILKISRLSHMTREQI
jgi:hypothetical protein